MSDEYSESQATTPALLAVDDDEGVRRVLVRALRDERVHLLSVGDLIEI